MSIPAFPDGFLWGTATAALQIEGSAGRGPSIWDEFAAQPGRIHEGHTPAIACDHVHRWAEDLDLMCDLGAGAYRFSVSWPRVLTPGGLEFYERLVDGLLARGIQPALTAFHWDLPVEVQEQGGWQRRDTAYRFAEYVDRLAAALGDRVTLWMTLNEPIMHFALGHVLGTDAPGLALGEAAYPVAHHLLLAHGLAVEAIRGHSSAPVGLVNNYTLVRSASPEHAALADMVMNHLFTQPVLQGSYPAGLAELVGPAVRDGDLEIVAAPLDFLGVNYYTSMDVTPPPDGSPVPFGIAPVPEGVPVTAFGWEILPEGLTSTLVGLAERYGAALPPVYVTEFGCSADDEVVEGRCDDQARIDYLAAHIGAIHAAISAGVDVRGAFVWTTMDNFEWAAGYSQRFGLVHVDFATGVRTPKASFRWLREALRAP